MLAVLLHLARSIRLPGVIGPVVTALHRCALPSQAYNALDVHLLTSLAVCRSPRNDLPCPACMPDQLHMCRKSPQVRGMPWELNVVVRSKSIRVDDKDACCDHTYATLSARCARWTCGLTAADKGIVRDVRHIAI